MITSCCLLSVFQVLFATIKDENLLIYFILLTVFELLTFNVTILNIISCHPSLPEAVLLKMRLKRKVKFCVFTCRIKKDY